MFFFFKQKTAYEMRISDWSSDVCSSDLDKYISASQFVELRGADVLVLPQQFAAGEVGARQLDAGFGFGQRGTGPLQFPVEAAVVGLQQHHALAHLLAVVDLERGPPSAADIPSHQHLFARGTRAGPTARAMDISTERRTGEEE